MALVSLVKNESCRNLLLIEIHVKHYWQQSTIMILSIFYLFNFNFDLIIIIHISRVFMVFKDIMAMYL